MRRSTRLRGKRVNYNEAAMVTAYEKSRRRTDPQREAETLREKNRIQTTVTQSQGTQTTTDSALQTTTKGKTTTEGGATETTTN